MNKLFRILNIGSQIALVVFLAVVAGKRVLQEADGMIPFLSAGAADSVSLSQPNSCASVETCSPYASECENLSYGEYDYGYDCEYMPHATLSPSLRKLEQAIGQMRVAGQDMANAAAMNDGTLTTAADDYRKALTEAREIYGLIRLRSDNEEFGCWWPDERQAALIGRRGEIRFQADELSLLGVQ